MRFMGKFGSLLRLAAVSLLLAGLAGCAGQDMEYASLPPAPIAGGSVATPQKPLQCVPYARDHSDVKIFGDAWTWWDQAAGRYAQGTRPQTGAVMVLTGYAGPERAHVAVVRQIISPREIRVDHANWLDDGAIYLDDPVQDVSAGNDWSQVRVFNIKTGGWGTKVYPVQGFIGGAGGNPVPEPTSDPLADLIARADQKNFTR
jgi:hypothetical protein